MKKSQLEIEYEKMVAEIEQAEIYDGRENGVDVYVCKKCGKHFLTRYADKGVTPFCIQCRDCGGTMTHEHTISETIVNFMDIKACNWVRPTFRQLLNFQKAGKFGTVQHILQGGLILESELYH